MSARAGLCQRVDYILQACRGRRVLHVGCADSPYTRRRLEDGTILYRAIESVAAAQFGIDLDPEGVQLLRDAGYSRVAVADVEAMDQTRPFGDVEFDVIVAGEILEHLPNPGRFLQAVKPLMLRSDSRLIVTTINAYGAYRILYELLKRSERVHPDHVYYFSRATLTRLLEICGYEVTDFHYYPVGREHLHNLHPVLRWADRAATRINPAFADGVMATCRLQQAQ